MKTFQKALLASSAGGGIKRNQQGAALIVVLSLLTVSLMLGLSSMQSSQIDERLAGNYRAAAEAQMGAEIAISEAMQQGLGSSDFEKIQDKNLSMPLSIGLTDFSNIEGGVFSDVYVSGDLCGGGVDCYYSLIDILGDFYIVAMGAVNDGSIAVSEPIFVEVSFGSGSGGSEPFDKAINACDDVEVSGSGNVVGGINAGGDVELKGGVSPPEGISVGGGVDYPDWWQYNESFMNVVDGYEEGYDVFPNGCDVLNIRDEEGEVGGFFSGVVDSPNKKLLSAWFDAGCPHCYDYKENVRKLTLTGGKGNNDASTTVLGESGEKLILEVDGDMGTQGRLSALEVRGDVTLIINGDFDLGDNADLTIAEGASLNIYTTGGVKLGGGTSLMAIDDFVRETFDGESKPAVAIYSTHQQTSGAPDVVVGGSNQSQVAIYAPYSDIRVTGSGKVIGSLRGRNVELRGSGEVVFPPELANYSLENGDDSDPSYLWW